MRANTPGVLPMINHAHRLPPLPLFTKIIIEPTTPSVSTTTTAKPRQSNQINSALLPRFHNAHLISQEAINSFVVNNETTRPKVFTPLQLCPEYTQQDLEHYGLAMVHPVTGKQITSYCKLMRDPATFEVWMTAFGEDFSGMCQSNGKTKMTGTDAFLSWIQKTYQIFPEINHQPTPKSLSHIDRKRRTLIAFESQRAEI
jgi:hypothetical protein